MKKLLVLFFLLILPISSLALTQDPLPINQAFVFSAAIDSNNTLSINWNIAPEHYLYKDRIQFQVMQPKDAVIGSIIFPKAIEKEDDIFGKYKVYKNKLLLNVPLVPPPSDVMLLKVNYQGCSEAGYCYPPTSKILKVNFKTDTVGIETTQAQAPITQTSNISSLLSSHHYFAIILGFLGFGLLLAFTPCVLPMIPILSSIIVGQKKIALGKSFRLSLIYVLAMALSYAIAGILVGYIGGNIQAAMQAPWVLILFSLLFVVLALSLFGFYELQLPQSFQTKINQISNQQKSGSYLGAFIMGVLATLIVSPCVTPPLVGALGYISQTGDAVLGGIALFSLGFGMGIPLIIIGTAGGKFLPKAGQWMTSVKAFFGVLLLAVAIWMLARILPDFVSMILWALLLIVAAVYLGTFKATQSGWQKFWQGIGIAIFIYGVILIIGVAMGNSNPLKPLAMTFATTAEKSPENVFMPIQNITALNQALAGAKQAGKPVMLDFYADWCISCKEMDATTLQDPAVRDLLKQFVLLRVNVTANNTEDQQLMREYQVIAPPTMIFYNAQGEQVKPARLVGTLGAKNFVKQLQIILKQ